MESLQKLAQATKDVSWQIATATQNKKNELLCAIATSILDHSDKILAANKLDCQNAVKNEMRESMIDRLVLTQERIEQICDALKYVMSLPDPVGGADNVKMHQNGMRIEKRRVPLGVVAMIYESRPNVTADAIGLCLKSSNAVILRGGKEAINSNRAIVLAAKEAAEQCGFSPNIIGFVDDTLRETTIALMKLNGYIDVLIPRGGAGLIKSVVENATIPIIETGTGNCHIYVDDSADFEMAIDIILNAKCSRPSVCNATEKVLIHQKVAEKFLPELVCALQEKNVEIRACEKVFQIFKNKTQKLIVAKQQDWFEEYNDYIIAIKIVENINQAIDHINAHNTKHSEAIITKDYENSQKFVSNVDAAAVYINASTRFTDGGVFGLGAEIGISTQKLHARGPMGLEALTTYKYCIYANGQIRK